MNKTDLQGIMDLSWGFVKRNGFSRSEALKTAWANYLLRKKMLDGIVRFYFRKVDGTTREAWGTLASNLIPPVKGVDRKPNPTVQTFYDTEKAEWRCYKIANLISIA